MAKRASALGFIGRINFLIALLIALITVSFALDSLAKENQKLKAQITNLQEENQKLQEQP